MQCLPTCGRRYSTCTAGATGVRHGTSLSLARPSGLMLATRSFSMITLMPASISEVILGLSVARPTSPVHIPNASGTFLNGTRRHESSNTRPFSSSATTTVGVAKKALLVGIITDCASQRSLISIPTSLSGVDAAATTGLDGPRRKTATVTSSSGTAIARDLALEVTTLFLVDYMRMVQMVAASQVTSHVVTTAGEEFWLNSSNCCLGATGLINYVALVWISNITTPPSPSVGALALARIAWPP